MDDLKQEKIAAAKKKLKQFQKKEKGPKKSKSKPENKDDQNGTHPAVENVVVNDFMSPPIATKPPVGHSETALITGSTEKLQQLSRQLNELQSETFVKNGSISDTVSANENLSELEERNQDLANRLGMNSQENAILAKQVAELQQLNSRLQRNADGDRKSFDEKLKRELGSLKEQLQVHIQTIGILVAEKTELQSSLNQTQKLAEQRIDEIDELSGRLKAARQRVAELERNFTSASSACEKFERSNKELQKEVDRLKLDLYKQTKSNDELSQRTTELQTKLQSKVSECTQLEDNVIEFKGKLEMTELNLQQLQSAHGDTSQDQVGIDALLDEKAELQKKISEYEETFQKVCGERDTLATQYQGYIDQLTRQVQVFQGQAQVLQEERDRLADQKVTLEKAINDLTSRNTSTASEYESLVHERTELKGNLDRVKAELDQVGEQYQQQVGDNSQLSKLIEEKEQRIEEMTLTLQRLNDNAVNKENLLDAMQSDKTALSRAMAQNKELKSQLGELQNGFITMSHENMELMTKVQSENHVAAELAQRLQQQEDELKELRDQLVTKEGQLRQMQEHRAVHDVQGDGEVALEDRLKHVQAQTDIVDALQKELTNAQDSINSLTSQNSLLRKQSQLGHAAAQGGDGEHNNSDELIQSLNASIRQLEMERNQVLEQCAQERRTREQVEGEFKSMQEELTNQSPESVETDGITKAHFTAIQTTMKQLETKYTQAMRDKADLLDEKERLEHLILQLQGETDTIGDYITIYQHQRSVMKRQEEEKNEYICKLSRDREGMLDKLHQLQSLVMQLVEERNRISTQPSVAVEAAQNRLALPPLPEQDWPNYDTDSSTSEVEAITADRVNDVAMDDQSSHDTSQHSSSSSQPPPLTEAAVVAKAADPTTQQIMSLLSELGSSSPPTPGGHDDHSNRISYVHCSQCSGQIIDV